MIYKCTMCGGELIVKKGVDLAECSFCGTKQTVPDVDDEKRLAEFERGNYYRQIGEFDSAIKIFEQIIRTDESDAEAHWRCALSRFGIEYVEDPVTKAWIPTCHRASYDDFLKDIDYLAAVKYSLGEKRQYYQREANRISDIQRGILATSSTEEPYDVFICYKDSDERGGRTKDSVLAQDIYEKLTEKGMRVFFSRITLEDKVGSQYEPYIFAALNSAKVMLVVTTRRQYADSVWVKNEWSRFLEIRKKDTDKALIPCYIDMKAGDLPSQLGHLQGYDMEKIGFMQDLVRGVQKILGKNPGVKAVYNDNLKSNQNADPKVIDNVKRGFISLEDGEWNKAANAFETALMYDVDCAEAYFGKYLIKNRLSCIEEFVGKYTGQKAEPYKVSIADENMDKQREEVVWQYVVPPLLSLKQLEGIFAVRRVTEYTAVCDEWKKKYETARKELEEDILLKRVQKLCANDFKKRFLEAKQKIYNYYISNIEASRIEDEQNRKKALEEDKKAFQEAEIAAKKLRDEALEKQKNIEEFYSNLCIRQSGGRRYEEFVDLSREFKQLGNYKDSAQRALQCNNKAESILRIYQARGKWKVRIIEFAVFTVIAVTAFYILAIYMPEQKRSKQYAEAWDFYERGNYSEAADEFKQLEGYKDSWERYEESLQKYQEYLIFEIDQNIQKTKYKEAYNLADILVTVYNSGENLKLRNQVAEQYLNYVREAVNSAYESGSYVSVVSIIDDCVIADADLREIRDIAASAFLTDVTEEAARIYDEKGYQAVIELLDEKASLLPGESWFDELYEYYEELKPVSLFEKNTVFGSVDKWAPVVTDVEDIEGQVHHTARKLSHTETYTSQEAHRIIFSLNNNYLMLKGTLVLPKGELEKNLSASNWLAFYNDEGKLIGETPKCNKNNLCVDFAIDVSNIEKLTIVSLRDTFLSTGSLYIIGDFELYKEFQ